MLRKEYGVELIVTLCLHAPICALPGSRAALLEGLLRLSREDHEREEHEDRPVRVVVLYKVQDRAGREQEEQEPLKNL